MSLGGDTIAHGLSSHVRYTRNVPLPWREMESGSTPARRRARCPSVSMSQPAPWLSRRRPRSKTWMENRPLRPAADRFSRLARRSPEGPPPDIPMRSARAPAIFGGVFAQRTDESRFYEKIKNRRRQRLTRLTRVPCASQPRLRTQNIDGAEGPLCPKAVTSHVVFSSLRLRCSIPWPRYYVGPPDHDVLQDVTLQHVPAWASQAGM